MDLSEVPTHAFLRHPWELSRARFFQNETSRALGRTAPVRVLDVGAGDGWFASTLLSDLPSAQITCWDTEYSSESLSKNQGIEFTRERPQGRFDFVLLLDVAEHVENDVAFLAEVCSLVEPGGQLLFSVPAWPRLYSAHDRKLRHYRRYTPQAARALLENAGLEIKRSGGLFSALLLPRAAAKWRGPELEPYTGQGGDEEPPQVLVWNHSRFLRSCVLAVLLVDCTLQRMAAALGVELPGLSWWAVCKKS